MSAQAGGRPLAVGHHPVPVWNVANALTGLRLLLVPVFLVLLLGGDPRPEHAEVPWRLAALGVFLLASATDRLDGEVARRKGLVTDLGKLLDPVADKALVGAALIGLSVLGEVPWWVTVVVMVRELGITLLRLAVLRRGVIAASRGGKLKTVLQTVALAMLVLPLPDALRPVALVVLGLAVVVTMATGLDYVRRAAVLVAEGRRADAGMPG